MNEKFTFKSRRGVNSSTIRKRYTLVLVNVLLRYTLVVVNILKKNSNG